MGPARGGSWFTGRDVQPHGLPGPSSADASLEGGRGCGFQDGPLTSHASVDPSLNGGDGWGDGKTWRPRGFRLVGCVSRGGRSAVSNSSFSTARSHHGSQSCPGSRGCPEDQTRSRGGRQAGPTHPLGDVWCREEDKHTGGPGPRRPRPRGPALPRHPRPRGRGGEAGRLPGSAHSLACSRIDCASTTTCQARGSCWDSRASETPLVRTSPPNGTAAGQADGVRTVRTAAARACSPTAGARETRAPPARWALHPNAAFALGSHLPWAAPAEGRARQTPWLGAEGLLPGPTLAQGLAGGFGETAGDLQGASALLRPRDLTPATRGQPALRASRPPSQGPSRALLSQREDPARPEQSE